MSPKIDIQVGDLRTVEVEAICCPVFEDVELQSSTQLVDQAIGGQISRLLELGDHKGKLKQNTVLYVAEGLKAPRICLVGLGKMEKLSLESIRQATAKSMTTLRDLGVKSAACWLPDGVTTEQVQALVVGTKLGLYQFKQHQTSSDDEQSESKSLEELLLLVPDKNSKVSVERSVRIAEAIADGTILARDLTNQPANYLTPTDLAETASRVAQAEGNGCLDCQIYNRPELIEKGFNALLGVAQGSQEEPKLIQLSYRPDNAAESTDTVVLVGKGITFDSGGLSLKSGSGMMSMKDDMAGAATVLGTMQVIGKIRPNLNVIGLIAATENMPSGTAQRPGDVVKSYGGKTIEILNTDAEGRLVLADALGYAKTFNPKAVVDLATLTGAVVTALGRCVAGIMGTDQELIDQLKAAGQTSHERLWQLPLFDDYDDALKSDIADVKNIGDGTAGAIAGAAFLKHFAQGYPWAHIDIAGASEYLKGSAYLPKGASGYGVRLLTQFIRNLDAKTT